MSRAELASSSEHSPTFQYKMAVKPEIYSMPDTLPSEGVFKTEVSSRFEELPKVEASKSEVSLGSDESSTLEENFISTAFPGPREPSSLEVPVPEVEAPSGHFLDEDVSREATEPLWEEEPFLQGEEPHLRALELLPGLHNPLAVEAKLARLSSTGAGLDVPQADVPKVTTQVADVMQDAMGAELSWGTEVMGHVQTFNLCCSGTAGTISAVSLAWRQLSCSGVWERETLSDGL